jgi:RNase P subunit RPR2
MSLRLCGADELMVFEGSARITVSLNPFVQLRCPHCERLFSPKYALVSRIPYRREPGVVGTVWCPKCGHEDVLLED